MLFVRAETKYILLFTAILLTGISNKAAAEKFDYKLRDLVGMEYRASDSFGKWLINNFWATWCAPCREEMPALDRLQEKLGGPDFQVLALSIDEAPPSVIRKFYRALGIESLFLFHDPSGGASTRLKLTGIPATFLLDRQGRGIGYFVGPVEWDKPEIVGEIRRFHVPHKKENIL